VEPIITAAINGVVEQGPLVALAIAALYYTRKDLADEKADNKELRGVLLKTHEATLSVVTKNTEAFVTLSERINDLKN